MRMEDIIYRFRYFKKEIIEMFDELNEIILEKIKFIYYCLLFQDKGTIDILSIYCKCLRKEPYNENEINSKKRFLEICNKMDKNCKDNGYKLFAIENIDHKFHYSLKNPFYYNSKYYSFPTLLKKNIIENDKEIKEAFINYLKFIYKSKIIKDIFYLSSEFNDFEYPFDNNEILEEALEYIVFMPLDGDELLGYTQKEIPEILISINLDEAYPKESDISKIVCELSHIINDCIYKQFNHYIKSLIFYNSFRFNIKKPISSNLYNYDENDKYIKGILSKANNLIMYSEIDKAYKTEFYLYGNILGKVYFPQAYEMFKKSNWNKEIIDHIKNFKLNNDFKEDISKMTFEQILKNDDLYDFFKKFVLKFMKLVGKEEFIIFDNNAFATRKSGITNINKNKNFIPFDPRCYIKIKKNYIYDASL